MVHLSSCDVLPGIKDLKMNNLAPLWMCLSTLAYINGILSDNIDVKNPVRSAAEDEIKSLPGLDYKLNFTQYSGYLEADDLKPTVRFWHYWLTESQSEPDKDPLVLWLNGGPGCSSLLGLLTELGPFRVERGGQIVDNPFAWNKRANVIFMESPANVGFSYTLDGSMQTDDDSTAKQNHQALRSFFRKFPKYKNRPLYLAGESYAGVYLPTLAVLVDKDPAMNLRGMAIGNGYLHDRKLTESLAFFSYYHGLVGETTWRGLAENCCGGQEPARGLCNITDPHRTGKCDAFAREVTENIIFSGLNPYNLYDRCGTSGLESPAHSSPRREYFERSLLVSFVNSTQSNRLSRSRGVTRGRKFELSTNYQTCYDEKIIIDYLNKPEVKATIHIPAGLNQAFSSCSGALVYHMVYPYAEDGLAPQMNKLIESPRNLTLLVYNGDVDMMCNFFGDEWFVDDLNRKVLSDYSPWHLDGQIAGFAKHYEGITFMTVKGAGHMVPTDKPAEALHMFNTFLYGHK